MEIEKILNKIDESLPNAVDKVLWDKITKVNKGLDEKLEWVSNQLKDIETEIETVKTNQKTIKSKEDNSYKEKMVNLVKEVVIKWRNFEDAKAKIMQEDTNWSGWEFVFDLFQRDVLQVINEEELLKELKQYTITWDRLKVPKYTNWVVTTFENEWVWASASEWVTEYINIDIKRAVSRLDISEELLQDSMTIPDIYATIIKDIWESQSDFLVNQIIKGDWTWNNFTWVLTESWVNQIQLETWKVSVKDLWDSDITDIITKAKMKFKKNKKNLIFVMSLYVLWVIQNMRTTTWMWLYPEARQNMPMLRWIRIVLSDQAPVQDATEDLPDTRFLNILRF